MRNCVPPIILHVDTKSNLDWKSTKMALCHFKCNVWSSLVKRHHVHSLIKDVSFYTSLLRYAVDGDIWWEIVFYPLSKFGLHVYWNSSLSLEMWCLVYCGKTPPLRFTKKRLVASIKAHYITRWMLTYDEELYSTNYPQRRHKGQIGLQVYRSDTSSLEATWNVLFCLF